MTAEGDPLVLRDPRAMLDETLQAWGGEEDLWVFGYASLIWRPEFDAEEQRGAVVHGWHRALRMRSRINRGTPQRPGLVFAQHKGMRGHPVGFSAELYSELSSLRGDEGARRLVARYPAVGIEVDDPGVLIDVDTEADLDAVRQAQQRGDQAPQRL